MPALQPIDFWSRLWHMLTAWSTFKVPPSDDLPPDLFDQFMPEWFRTPISNDVTEKPVYSEAATIALHDRASKARLLANNPGIIYKGSTHGTPYEVVTSKTPRRNVLVADQWGSNVELVTGVPIPDEPYIQNYPNPTGDSHWIAVDIENMELWETITFRPTIDLLGWGYGHTCSSLVKWDLTTPWDEQAGPRRGVIAGMMPNLPLIVRGDELRRGVINHPIGLVVDNYMPCYSYPAYGSDGRGWDQGDLNTLVQPQPLCAGTHLRLDEETTATMMKLGGHASIVAQAMRSHGLILVDMTGQQGLCAWMDAPDGKLSKSNVNKVTPTIRQLSVVEGHIPNIVTKYPLT